jgi:hypothetical protein
VIICLFTALESKRIRARGETANFYGIFIRKSIRLKFDFGKGKDKVNLKYG